MTSLTVTRIRTQGVFSLDGQDFDVENNVWLVGDDNEVIVIDAAHDAGSIAHAVGGRRVKMIVATHGHNDHINAAVELATAVDAPVGLHPADAMLWEVVYPECRPDVDLSDGDRFDIGGQVLEVLHTPGHSPGGVCLLAADVGTLWTGDTLFHGGPGATGRSFSSFPTIIESIRGRLLGLPGSTLVHTGHGDDTTIGSEAPNLDDWIARGH
jgi:glyoxylase-like metal-dependent hydrolase (beta-lactamase superfamily II)